MSTRVQKGSQKFKPVVKSRVRAEGTPAPKPSPNPPSAGLATGSSKPSSKKGGAANLLAIESATSTHNVAEEVVIGDDCVSSARAERPPLLSKARNGTSPELQDLPDLVQHARAVHTRSNDSGSSTYVLEEQTLPMISNATTENRDSNPELASSFPEAAGSLPGADTIHGSPSAPETAPGQEIPLSVRSANEMGTTADNGRRTSSRLRTKGAVSYVSAEENGGNGPSERGSKVAIEIEDTVAAEDSSSASEDDVVVPRKTRKKRKRDVDAQDEPEPRPRRRRKAKTANFLDEDAAPGEDLDPTTITMADICEDTGQGRISSKAAAIQKNHLEWKNANRAKRERMRAIMEAKKYGRKEDDTAPVQEAVRESDGEEGASQADATNETPGPEEIAEDGFDYRQTLPSNRFNAQVRIGANGETIIDEESLFVERADQDDAAQQYQHVEESDATKFTNSATYAKKIRSSRWSGEETELFFHALQQFGENYELISLVLPGRDRKSCKSKFKLEDKRNGNRITFCLNNRIPYDIDTLSRLTGKDFSGPPPEVRTPVVSAPEAATSAAPTSDSQVEAGQSSSNRVQKKSKKSAPSEDVEVMGDVDSFDPGFPDD